MIYIRPIIFIILYINNLPEISKKAKLKIKNMFIFFADDTKMIIAGAYTSEVQSQVFAVNG